MTAYYNERDPFAAEWLRNLIVAGLIAPGHVDDRSIDEVRPDDLRGFTQCHFFAGIAGWSIALRLAGWPDDRECWTGSCPCQPFSAAGKGEAFEDERHLWPVWFGLIRAVRPSVIFGEQVDDAIGWGWLDLVHDDMEAEGYAVRSAVLPACSVGAPHIRQRLWFVADAGRGARAASEPGVDRTSQGPRQEDNHSAFSGRAGKLADAHDARRGAGRAGEESRRQDAPRVEPSGLLAAGLMGDALGPRLEGRPRQRGDDGEERPALERAGDESVSMADASDGGRGTRQRDPDARRDELHDARGGAPDARSANPWSELQWLPCTDGRARPTKPGLFPLAHGVSARVGKLRAAGNAIVPQVAAKFIKAVME